MKQTDHRANRIHHMPRAKLPRVRTVDDLLARDDVNGILADLAKLKPDIKSLIMIYLDHKDVYHWNITDNTLESTATWMLESTKLDLLSREQEE